MTVTRRSFLAACLVCAITACGEARPLPPERAIVILISIDGFRTDYLDKFKPPTLLKLAKDGVRAEGLIPQFPSNSPQATAAPVAVVINWEAALQK